MNNTIISALDEQFYIDCKVVATKYEYPQYTGIEKWIIITDLTEEELKSKYAEQIAPLKPYIILSHSFGEVRDDFRRNEKKHQMRAIRNGHAFDFSEDTEEHHAEILSSISLEDEIIYNEEIQQLRDAIQKLNTIQKTRLVKYFFEGKTFREIASEENVNIRAVAKSIEVAIKNLKKFL